MSNEIDIPNYIDLYYYFMIDNENLKYMYLNTLIIVGGKNRYKGEGTKALNKVIDIAKANSCKYIELSADTKQPQADGFILTEWYKKFGFKEIGKHGYMVKMRLSL